ncbi:MAG: type IV conjugative transfer system protein TraL [Pseudomonadota bacterium]
MQTVRFPRTVDDPPTILMWRVDDFAPLFLGFLIGYATGYLVTVLGVSLIAVWIFRKFRLGAQPGFFVHFLYWQGFMPVTSHALINPFERELRG